MQQPAPLNDHWARVQASVQLEQPSQHSTQTVGAMLTIAETCADELRNNPPAPLTDDEQAILANILANDLEDHPRYHELLYQRDAAQSAAYVLEYYGNAVAQISSSRDDDGEDSPVEDLACTSIACWDHVVPEYEYHQLAHLAALVAAQIVSTQVTMHGRTWLFCMSDGERWALFLALAQELEILPLARVDDLAASLTTA